MAVITLTTDQVLTVVEQLTPEEQIRVLRSLLLKRWPKWVELVEYAQPKARTAAALRDKNWDALSDDERDQFVDDVLHEND